ncbi:MAG: AAA family ATPase [Acetobacterium sp.]|nr:AAA family ATPase [Acetobacterium sp.]
MNTIVRMQSMTIKNIKNVKSGVADFPSYKNETYFDGHSEILGLYGQNGSGKTTLINMAGILKRILSGKPLPETTIELMDCNEQESALSCVFYIEKNKTDRYLAYYQLVLRKTDDAQVAIIEEKLSYKNLNEIEGKRKTRKLIIGFDWIETITVKPKEKFKDLKNRNVSRSVAFKIAMALAAERKTSFIFSPEISRQFSNDLKDETEVMLIEALKTFGRRSLCVIENDRLGSILMNILIPFSFRIDSKTGSAHGEYPLALTGDTLINEEEYELTKKIIQQINVVLSKIVPDLQLEVLEKSSEYSKNGEKKIRIELVTERYGRKVSLKNESDGIVKIISILSSLIAVYNRPSFCMFVDELDSGIFEFLLGEILKVMSEGGKGQLIFTSHNLRPLEVLNANNILFTTSNPEKRYVYLPNIKKTNNLRDVYLRTIYMGGNDDQLYLETDAAAMRKAFRKADGLFKDE